MNKYIGLLGGVGALAGIIYVLLCPSSPVYGWLQKDRYKVIGDIMEEAVTFPEMNSGPVPLFSAFVLDTATGVIELKKSDARSSWVVLENK